MLFTSLFVAVFTQDMGIPCFLGGMTRGLLGRNSHLHIRQKRRDALRDADLVILAGAVCDFRLSYGQVLSRRSKIIAINRNKEQLYKVLLFNIHVCNVRYDIECYQWFIVVCHHRLSVLLVEYRGLNRIPLRFVVIFVYRF